VAEPKNGTQAFVNISLNDTVSINSARIVNGKKGMFLSMPQSKDKNGEFRDIAFPLNGDVRKTIAKDALTAFEEKSAMRESKKQGIGEKIAAGVEKAMQYTAAAPPRVAAAAKSSPGLGD
jgi:stage V sporulation protein G